MTAPDFITAPTVAHLIGFGTVQTFRAHRPDLEARGFPRPLPTSRRPLRWRRAAVLAWLEEAETLEAEFAAGQFARGATVTELRRARA